MRTKGFVLVLCLLFGLLASALALAALTLSQLSSQLNQGLLLQQQQLRSAELAALSLPVSKEHLLTTCEASYPAWPPSWQQCEYQLSLAAGVSDNSYGRLSLSWQVNPHTQGGEL